MSGHGDIVLGSYWLYAPNKGAPVFFTVAFFGSLLWHVWQATRYKSWRLTGFLIFASLLFVVGFAFRIYGAFHYDNLIVYIVSICLCFAAPPLYELANFYTLGRILYFVPYHSPIHPGRVLTTFLALSTLVESLSGVGASFVANQSLPVTRQTLGKNLLRASLIIQLIVIILFLSLATSFWLRCRKHGINHTKINQPLITLFLSNALILARCLFRTVEFFELENMNWSQITQDTSRISPSVRYEVFFYIFEAALMLINTYLINVRHPRRWLDVELGTKVYLAKDGITEIEGPGYKEDRNFFLTLVDPFDLWGLARGKDNKTRFWDDDGANSSVKAGSSGASPQAQQ
jgi:hypothetical protein